MAQFEQALKKLVEDAHYRDAVVEEPDRLTKDFKGLDAQDMLLLMQVWHATGDPAAARMIMLCHCCCGHTKKQARA